VRQFGAQLLHDPTDHQVFTARGDDHSNAPRGLGLCRSHHGCVHSSRLGAGCKEARLSLTPTYQGQSIDSHVGEEELGGQRRTAVESLLRMTRGLRVMEASLTWIALATLVVGTLGAGPYHKDLQAEYLTASALRDGVNVLAPLSELSVRYFPTKAIVFQHPSPYPPWLALAGLPLTLLPFPVAVQFWLALNVGLLLIAGRWLGLSIQWSLALVAWPPMWFLFNCANVELLLLVVAMEGWRAAADGRNERAGLWLGLAAAIKLYPVLLLVPFAARRRWRLVFAAGVVIALSQLADVAIVGPSGFIRYYTEILPAVSSFYAHLSVNSSPYGALLRLFGGASDVSPLIYAPRLVLPVTLTISLLALVALATLEPEAAPVAMLVALPSVWFTYAVLALPQMARLLRCPTRRWAAVLACIAASIVLSLGVQLGGDRVLPMAALLAVQPAGFIGLLVLSIRMHSKARTSTTPLVRHRAPHAPCGRASHP
jgi:hypothetical protein